MEPVIGNKNPIWIGVETSEGMFSTERAVSIKLSNGSDISLFADEGLLKEEGGEWKLKVTPIKTNNTTQIVLLPVEPIETPSRWVEVPIK